jgi:hypothetical protein
MQMVERGEKTFAEASLEAGDKITNTLREFRTKVFSICQKELGLPPDTRLTGLVGGDELTIAIDLNATDTNGNKIFDAEDKKINELILWLKKETNSRVVKTVVAESRRTSDSNDTAQNMADHLAALKKAEEGAGQAKELEGYLRKLEKVVAQNSGNSKASELMESLKNFVITEVHGQFVVRTEKDADIPLAQIIEKIKNIYG